MVGREKGCMGLFWGREKQSLYPRKRGGRARTPKVTFYKSTSLAVVVLVKGLLQSSPNLNYYKKGKHVEDLKLYGSKTFTEWCQHGCTKVVRMGGYLLENNGL